MLPPLALLKKPQLYAHRGARLELPENTLPAFALALDLGADAIETDAHLTRDGHVVLSHDATGARMCGTPKAISEASLDEVQSWDAGAGGRHAGQGYRIPSLAEALAEFPGVPLNVDAKSQHPDMVLRLLDVVNRAGASDSTLIASFHAATLAEVRRCGYRGATGLASPEVLRLLALPKWALALFPLPGAAAQIPYRRYGIDLGTRAVVSKCHALGLLVHYWTVNDPLLASRLLDAGADGIITDDTRTMVPVFEAWRKER